MNMRSVSFTTLLPSPSNRRASARSSRREQMPTNKSDDTNSTIESSSTGSKLQSSSSDTVKKSNSSKMAGGRDSLVADLFWTFHGENANKFADVTLISSDGRSFPCCRGILAARSEHFARLLFSDPGHRQLSNVRIDLPGNVLALIVQYLHTGDIAAEDSKDRNALDRLLDVARAAHSMSHSALFTDCIRHLLNIVGQNRTMLCPVFEAFFGEGSVVDGASLLEPLLQHVRHDPSATLLIPNLGAGSDDLRPPVATGPGVGEPIGVLELSGRALETLIAEDKKSENTGDDVHEEYWFYVIWYWAMHGPSVNAATAQTSSQDGTVDEANIKEMSIESIARRTHAMQIIDLLDARRMRAAFLLRVVEPTGLMSLQKLCEGYKAHATGGLKNVDWTRKRIRFRQRSTKS